jgi:hypothetical protein
VGSLSLKLNNLLNIIDLFKLRAFSSKNINYLVTVGNGMQWSLCWYRGLFVLPSPVRLLEVISTSERGGGTNYNKITRKKKTLCFKNLDKCLEQRRHSANSVN